MEEGAGLKASLGFQLKMTMMQSDLNARNALAKFDISPARVSALMLVKANPGCTQTALGTALHVNRASAMKLVNFLESRNLVVRSASSDPRANALYLTPQGEAQLAEMSAALYQSEQAMFTLLSKEERATLVDLLDRVRQGLSECASGRTVQNGAAKQAVAHAAR